MAVRVLRSAPSEHVEDLAYLMARLKGDPRAAVLATDVEPAWTSLRSIAETCTQESDPKVLQQAELLRAAADPMDAAFRRRSETRVAESAAYGRLQTRKIEATNTCRRVGFHLTGRFPFNHKRVRTFFRVNYRQPSSPAPEEPVALIRAKLLGVNRQVPPCPPRAAPPDPPQHKPRTSISDWSSERARSTRKPGNDADTRGDAAMVAGTTESRLCSA